jgi:AraC-like DNA-binding protein
MPKQKAGPISIFPEARSANPIQKDPAGRLLAFVLRNATVKTNLCTLERREDGFTLKSRIVPDYNFIFVSRGKAIWNLENSPEPLHPGDLLLVPPGPRHHGESLTPQLTLLSIHVEVRLPGGQDVFSLLLAPRRQNVPRNCRLDRYLRAAAREFDRPAGVARLMLESWGRLVAFEFLQHSYEQGRLQSRGVSPMVMRLLEESSRWIDRRARLPQLAQRAGYSPQHLNRLFHRALGCTPLKYLMRLRMERAAELLLDGNHTVAAIAASSGFEDPFYFSRVFKQHLGCSPAVFRAAATASESPS